MTVLGAADGPAPDRPKRSWNTPELRRRVLIGVVVAWAVAITAVVLRPADGGDGAEAPARAAPSPSASDAPLTAEHPEIPAEHALQGFDGVRAYSGDPDRTAPLLERVLGARPVDDGTWELRGAVRGGTITYEPPPPEPGRQSAGSVHHVAWGTTIAEHPRWAERLDDAGVQNTGVIDRHYFHSIYFREPSGVLFEIADDGPGFTVDSPVSELGRRIILPPRFEEHRERLEAILTPLPDPRADWPTHAG
jgi:glyoxalase family protein